MNLGNGGEIVDQIRAGYILPVPDEASGKNVRGGEIVIHFEGHIIAVVVSFPDKRVTGGVPQKRFAAVARTKTVNLFRTRDRAEEWLHRRIGRYPGRLQNV